VRPEPRRPFAACLGTYRVRGLLHASIPAAAGWTWLRKLGGCVVVEQPVPLSSGPRLPGSGSRLR